jgi:hypothetical protein
MKVIKEGKTKTTPKWTQRCYGDSRQGCDDVTFNCPVCSAYHNLNRVPDDSVPREVRRRIAKHGGLPPISPVTCKVVVMRGRT